MPRPTSAADATPVRVVIVTLDGHLASAVERAQLRLRRELPGISLKLHAVAEWSGDPAARERCLEDIAKADVIIATMLFMEDHIRAVLPALEARRDSCDALVGCMSSGEVIRLTRLGELSMDGSTKGIISLLKRLRGAKKKGKSAGMQQMTMLRRLPRLLRYIPGTAQDLRAYFLTLQYWMSGSDEDVANLVRFLVGRYAKGERAALKGALKSEAPKAWPDVGLYHPRCKGRITERLADLPRGKKGAPRVGLLLMRSYILAGNSAHYDGVIAALEARGIEVVPAFACGLDARPAVERFFQKDGKPAIDALVSLTGFSLVGGPAYNDSKAAAELLGGLDVPYIAAHALEFQSLEQWQGSKHGLTPVEATMMVAIPELDGATSPMLFGGRSEQASSGRSRDMQAHEERAGLLAARIERMIALRRKPKAERKLGIVLFNFPPNAGGTGTAAYLSVFKSLFKTLTALKAEGYDVELPGSLDELRAAVLEGNAKDYGAEANVADRVTTETHLRRQPWLAEIEKQWGPAPGRHNSDGSSIHILGARFGKVMVGVQPAFGYEGDPMRLLFEEGMAPTHAFCAFYDYIKLDFGADAVLHFGTHGALEFMPGKQTALSEACWPDRLIGALPNFYLYAANNPSEGAIAKRRSAATLVSYLTPPLAKAGLHKELEELRSSIDSWRHLPPEKTSEREELAKLIQIQASAIELAQESADWGETAAAEIEKVRKALRDLEATLIPYDMHVLGEPFSQEQRRELLEALEEERGESRLTLEALASLAGGAPEEETRRLDQQAGGLGDRQRIAELAAINTQLSHNGELEALLHALDGGFVKPAPGGDLLRNPEILPTGRNINSFDPYGIPSAFSVAQGARQAERLLARHESEGKSLPESVALVLWGTDNLKSEGTPIGIALALVGARPRFDSYSRLCGAELIPLAELGRPRIDVVITLSGIFRDLLPLQTKLLAEACYLAAAAEEPAESNFLRKHSLAQMAENPGMTLDTAALRVFSNAEGTYGANVNHLIESGAWAEEDELSDAFMARKSFAYGRDAQPVNQQQLMRGLFKDVDLAYQNLESVELGITTLDYYFDTLGGISRSVQKSRGAAPDIYVGDQTSGDGKVRTLTEQVALETHTRILNPKWYESMLSHGHEGVRQIEAQITNTFGWSATAGAVSPWVYEKVTEKFVLDSEMRKRLAALNPVASARLANRLLEACERRYWEPDEALQASLREVGEELEDWVEGIKDEVAA